MKNSKAFCDFQYSNNMFAAHFKCLFSLYFNFSSNFAVGLESHLKK